MINCVKWLSCWVMDDNINCEDMNCLWIDGIVNVDVNYDDYIEMRQFEGNWMLSWDMDIGWLLNWNVIVLIAMFGLMLSSIV